ncbi:transglycosylase SLT domain-containing protein [Streptomyces sp. NPDC046862]|uniref:transglycosylase SLT domain-containing protein n=1 Tax=Streptomyces sp. NPDC046862 TaxID=3154603 RepID=UPI0034512E73
MPKFTTIVGRSRALPKAHKLSLAGVAGLGAASVALTLVPGGGQASAADTAVPAAKVVSSQQQAKDVKAALTDQLANAGFKAEAAAAKKKTADEAAKKAAAEAAAKKKADLERAKKEAASRSAQRLVVKPVAAKTYPNNLDGWIRQSLDIMKQHKIPGSYDGIKRNILRESSGNPKAINNWDINAINGIPSKGLLQVIPPTFKTYHVPGTSWDIYNPVSNITAACNYAADRYGSMDNVNSAY